ncbi:SAM hydrolase/SAM-dependent halogenase family protein [Halalkalirubrum salinum]|uniref:SAM hydrolase/SAM-dependent halogenase family protein n=1 Tax=Halalkalirubrum salinum TaxID=2563889 RepID=UPI0010FB2687|nr:SAM-dependent chlorinase/fluorinase [Halalkalirubrum salinum]
MITIASDFGSVYPAAMKGVILRETDARLVDIAHDLPRQDPRGAAFWLRFALVEFPPAVHLAVVDPGVGTDRRPIVLRAGEHALVGPDNGSLVPAARALSDGAIDAYEIESPDPASATFHGRDVFAPAAAWVNEQGVDAIESIDQLSAIERYVDLTLPEPDVSGTQIDGTVLVVDSFGNVITDIPGSAIDAVDRCLVNGESVLVVETFEAVDRGSALVTVGSHGYVELDVNHGRGDERFGIDAGDSIELVLVDCNE